MKLSVPSFARKLSLPSPRRPRKGADAKRSLSRSEAPSFASSSSSSSSDDALALRSSSTPRSVLPAEIPRRELAAVLRRLGHAEPSDADLDAVAEIAAQPPAAGDADDGDLMDAFRVFDADGDGRITAEELRAVMEAILGADAGCTLDDCRRMIGGVDADGDGFVGFQDFARMMTMTATNSAADDAQALS